MSSGHKEKSFFWGVLLIALGALLLLDTWNFLDFGYLFENFWPLILVFIGIRFLFKRNHSNRNHYAEPGQINHRPNNTVHYDNDHSNVFGDVRLRFDDKVIDNFSCNNVFGDISLDFSRANFQAISNVQVNGVFGDIEIILHQKINLEIHGNVSFGSMRVLGERRDGIFNQLNYSETNPNPEYPTVKINATQVFGDIQIFYQN